MNAGTQAPGTPPGSAYAPSPHGMYLRHFQLRTAPFGITPDPAFFYEGNTRGALLDALLYAVTQGEGIVKLTGEVGSGKTMLCRMLAERLPAHVEVLYLLNPCLEPDEVLYAIAAELGLELDGRRADEVLRALHAELIARHAAGRQVVLLAEEAQAMPVATLEAVRLLTNLETASHKLLQIVLFGQPELDRTLDLPQLRQLKERITHSFTVPRLPPALLNDYLACRLAAAGRAAPLAFTPAALRQLAHASQGIVRRINILADKALLAAFADDAQQVQGRHMRLAIADSPFQPAPWHAGRLLAATLSALMLVLAAALLWQWLAPGWAAGAGGTGGTGAASGAAGSSATSDTRRASAISGTGETSGTVPPPAASSRAGATRDGAGAARGAAGAGASAASAIDAPQAVAAPAMEISMATTAGRSGAPVPASAATHTGAATGTGTRMGTGVGTSVNTGIEKGPASANAAAAQHQPAAAATPLLDSSLAASRTWLAAQAPGRLVLRIASLPATETAGAEAFLRQAQQAIGLRDLHVFHLPASASDTPGAAANSAAPARAARLDFVYGSYADRASAQAVWARLAGSSPRNILLLDIDNIRTEIKRGAAAKP